MTDDHITTDVIGLSTTLERFDADAENPVSLITADDDGVLHIADLEQLSRDIDFINDQLDNTVFTPEDRAFVKDGRAKVNKLNKAIVSAVRDEKSRVFDELDRERKSVEKKLDAINKSLGRTLQDFDQQVREEKRAEMESSFCRRSGTVGRCPPEQPVVYGGGKPLVVEPFVIPLQIGV